ncbi:MAG: hypothetical protein A2Y07_07895 [Planctomycetes bacterium GWF2_50_10]|nr:MAG: hypothetical protein A2Y07_07895 [Planctomycetes bacterium GWF2_50_10]
MTDTYIKSVATANPARYVTQNFVLEFLRNNFPLSPSQDSLYEKILSGSAIRGRYFALDYDEQICLQNPDEQNARFLKFARQIAVQAARKAIHNASLAPANIKGLVVNTCTGYLCPGLSSYIIEDLGLASSTEVFDIMGMGCGAAIPNLRCASSLAKSGCDNVLSIAVEICSATLFMGDDPELVVSNCIFGDGAAAAILSSSHSGPTPNIKLIDFESQVMPKHREQLRYRMQDGRLRNVLSIRVPVIAANAVAEVTARLLAQNNIQRENIDHWVLHPGGTAILKQVQEKLQLPSEKLAASHKVLSEYGNMSSPSVLFVLSELLKSAEARPGEKIVLSAFGAGFSAYAALAELT